MLRRFGILLLVGLVALGSSFIVKRLDTESRVRAPTGDHIPDFYMESFETTVMDSQGRPSRRLAADYMAHFPDTDTKEFAEPYLVLYRQRGNPWHVTSDRAWVSADDDVMLLLGDVHIWRDDDVGVRELDIKTEDLRVLPQTNYAETEKPVVIGTPTSETHSVGMKAYLEESRLELLADVETLIAPKSE